MYTSDDNSQLHKNLTVNAPLTVYNLKKTRKMPSTGRRSRHFHGDASEGEHRERRLKEVENREVEHYKSFEDFKAAIAK